MRNFIIVILTVMLFGSAWAAEKNPLEILDARTQQLLDQKDENLVRQFEAIRSSHGILRAVENVQSSVGRAVDSCGTKNPDMKESLDTRFGDWKLAIRPSVQQGKERLEKMILLQSFARPSEVRAYLKLFDDAVAFRDKGIKAVPVDDKDSCEKMLDEMDDTQKNLPKLLIENLGLDRDVNIKPST